MRAFLSVIRCCILYLFVLPASSFVGFLACEAHGGLSIMPPLVSPTRGGRRMYGLSVAPVWVARGRVGLLLLVLNPVRMSLPYPPFSALARV